MEEWCKIPEFDNYKISTDGRIWSFNSKEISNYSLEIRSDTSARLVRRS